MNQVLQLIRAKDNEPKFIRAWHWTCFFLHIKQKPYFNHFLCKGSHITEMNSNVLFILNTQYVCLIHIECLGYDRTAPSYFCCWQKPVVLNWDNVFHVFPKSNLAAKFCRCLITYKHCLTVHYTQFRMLTEHSPQF